MDLDALHSKVMKLESLFKDGAAALASDPAVTEAIKTAVDDAVGDLAKVVPQVAELETLASELRPVLPALKKMIADYQKMKAAPEDAAPEAPKPAAPTA